MHTGTRGRGFAACCAWVTYRHVGSAWIAHRRRRHVLDVKNERSSSAVEYGTIPPIGSIDVVLIGIDSLQGLQAARILKNHGLRVVAIAADARHPYCTTSRVEKVVHVPSVGPELLDVLLGDGSDPSGDDDRPVLLACQDKSVRFLSKYRDRLSVRYRFSLPPASSIRTLMDKASFLEFASGSGIRVPDYAIVRNEADLERAAAELGFPCIYKPSIRGEAWDAHSTLKVLTAQTPDELRDIHRRCSGWADAFIAQTLIPGGDDCLYSFNGYFDAHGTALTTFVARKLRQWPPGAGSSCLGEEVRDDDLLGMALELFASLPYQGLAYLETKRHPDTGQHYAIEANVGRPTGRSAIAEAGGVELLHTMYCDVVGLPLPNRREQTYGTIKWIDVRHDLQSAFRMWRAGDLSMSEWARSYRGPKQYAIASWRDPAPFVHDLIGSVRKTLSG